MHSLQEIEQKLKIKGYDLRCSEEKASKQLKIRKKYIPIIEKGRIAVFQSNVYFFGYVNQYSKLLSENDRRETSKNIKPANENFFQMARMPRFRKTLPSKIVNISCIILIILTYML